jgi:hypothetical protein
MRTVRDFKEFVLREVGVPDHFAFNRVSRAHCDFFEKLNRLSWQKKTKEPEETDDIDAVAPLTEEEWVDLEAKFRKLQGE